MAEAKHPSGGGVAARRPVLRGDLKFVYDTAEAAAGRVRAVDPRSGRQYEFDRREHFLCRAADGETDIAGLGARLAAEGLEPMSEAEITKFFRRLHILGFLQPEPAAGEGAPEGAPSSDADRPSGQKTEAAARSSGRDLLARRRREMAEKSATPDPAIPGSRPAPAPGGATRGGGLMERRRLERKLEQAAGSARPGTGARPELPPGSHVSSSGRRLLAPKAPAGPGAARGTGKGSDLVARRRREQEMEAAPPPVAPAPKRDPAATRDLLARRRKELEARSGAAEMPPENAAFAGGKSEPETPKTPAPSKELPKAGPAALTPELTTGDERAGPREISERKAATAPEQSSEAALTETAPEAAEGEVSPGADMPRDKGSDPQAPPRPKVEGVARPTPASEADPALEAESAAAKPVEAGTDADPAPDTGTPDRSVSPLSGPAPGPAPELAAEEKTKEKTAPPDAVQEVAREPAQERAAPARSSGPPAAAEPRSAGAAKDEDGSASETAAQAAMASARDLARRAAPAGDAGREAAAAGAESPAGTAKAPPAPAAPPSGQKPAPRNSDLMARRLRERANRGHVPKTGQPSDPIDPAPSERRGAAPAGAAGPARAIPPGPDSGLDFDFLQDDFDDGMGGGMPGTGGGMHGGMGGGPGGMMGGGMRGGMMGGGMGGMRGGMMGGMGGGPGGMMGGMRGGMGGMMGKKEKPKSLPGQLPLFNPQRLLQLLYILFYPLKYVLWVIVPLTAIAVMTVIDNASLVGRDIVTMTSDFSYIALFLLALFGASLVARIAQGVAIVAHGGQVTILGIALILGFIPRFTIDRSDIENLDRTGQLWSYGAPLLGRLGTFCIGILVWAMSRDGGGLLPFAALVMAQYGAAMFLITAWPFFFSDGRRWLAVKINEPKLMGKALMAVKYVFTGGDRPPVLERKEVLPFFLFGMATALTVVFFASVVIIGGITFLVGQYDGLGLVLFLTGVGAFLLWLSALMARSKASRGNFNKDAFKEMARSRRPDFAPEPGADEDREAVMPARAKVIWAMIFCGLIAVAFLPYEYETGGEVEILPITRGQATARTEGELVEVLAFEGDEVERGQVVARLSSWDQEADILSTEASLAGERAALAKLEAGATPEEIEVARKQLESAQASVAFKQAEADRNRELARTGVVSQAALEKALSDLEVDLADLEVARANYNQVVAPATAEELTIARAEVERLEKQLAFQRDELERTKIVAPLAGRVVTPDLQLRQGSYLRPGDVLLEIERTDVVTATILVTEADIGLIDQGDTVRLKIAGRAEAEVLGTVKAIAPSATEEEGFGRAIRVTAEFQNLDHFLRSGMTGYAKVDGEEMRVWEAYMRSIRHFFQIEVWSWIP